MPPESRPRSIAQQRLQAEYNPIVLSDRALHVTSSWQEVRQPSRTSRITAFYEKVIKVKADVAAVLVCSRTIPAEVLHSVKGVRQDVHLDP